MRWHRMVQSPYSLDSVAYLGVPAIYILKSRSFWYLVLHFIRIPFFTSAFVNVGFLSKYLPEWWHGFLCLLHHMGWTHVNWKASHQSIGFSAISVLYNICISKYSFCINAREQFAVWRVKLPAIVVGTPSSVSVLRTLLAVEAHEVIVPSDYGMSGKAACASLDFCMLSKSIEI